MGNSTITNSIRALQVKSLIKLRSIQTISLALWNCCFWSTSRKLFTTISKNYHRKPKLRWSYRSLGQYANWYHTPWTQKETWGRWEGLFIWRFEEFPTIRRLYGNKPSWPGPKFIGTSWAIALNPLYICVLSWTIFFICFFHSKLQFSYALHALVLSWISRKSSKQFKEYVPALHSYILHFDIWQCIAGATHFYTQRTLIPLTCAAYIPLTRESSKLSILRWRPILSSRPILSFICRQHQTKYIPKKRILFTNTNYPIYIFI